MRKKPSKNTSLKVIQDIQNDPARVVLDNDFRIVLFTKDGIAIKNPYTAKIFYELVSQLNPSHLEGLRENENVKLSFHIQDFIGSIEGNAKNYKHVIEAADILQHIQVKWTENVVQISAMLAGVVEHHPQSGEISFQLYNKLAARLLSVKEKGNFSFYKVNVFKLKGLGSIRLYTYFKSWMNYKAPLVISLERFKEMFEFDSAGYERFQNLKKYVIDPSIAEINEKTDLLVSWKPLGENMDGIRPRVVSLEFRISPKELRVIPKELQELNDLEEAISRTVPRKPVPTEAQIGEVAKRIGLTTAQLEFLTDELQGDAIRIWENLRGFEMEQKNRKGTAQEIRSVVGYILRSTALGVGLWEKEQNQQDQAALARAQQLLPEVKGEYRHRTSKHLIELYEKSSMMQKMLLIQEVLALPEAERSRFWFNKEGDLTEKGKKHIGNLLAEKSDTPKSVRQANYIAEVQKRFGFAIAFDENDEVVLG